MESVLGALIGDAAGATLEFREDITPELVRNAMKMPGGGVLKVGPGQITDDGELTIALWRGLTECKDSKNFPTEHVLRSYISWFNSMPFDMGGTCGNAFSEAYEIFMDNDIYHFDDEKIAIYKEYVEEMNIYSQANGALMRATAIALWARENNINIVDAIEFAKQDAKLSHPHIVCQEVNAIYIFAILLLLEGYTPRQTLHMVDDYIKNNITSDNVKKWFYEESHDISTMNCKNCCGHVRHAFVLSIYFLRNPDLSYEHAIYLTLLKGGDTDTNAAIVGGLVACYSKIPEYMLQPVLNFDCCSDNLSYKKGHKRPIEYSVKETFKNYI